MTAAVANLEEGPRPRDVLAVVEGAVDRGLGVGLRGVIGQDSSGGDQPL